MAQGEIVGPWTPEVLAEYLNIPLYKARLLISREYFNYVTRSVGNGRWHYIFHVSEPQKGEFEGETQRTVYL